MDELKKMEIESQNSNIQSSKDDVTIKAIETSVKIENKQIKKVSENLADSLDSKENNTIMENNSAENEEISLTLMKEDQTLGIRIKKEDQTLDEWTKIVEESKAKQEIGEQETQKKKKKRYPQIHFVIPNHMCGKFIGKYGFGITTMKNRSSAMIHVMPSHLFPTQKSKFSQRVVKIYGIKQNIFKAIKLVAERVSWFTETPVFKDRIKNDVFMDYENETNYELAEGEHSELTLVCRKDKLEELKKFANFYDQHMDLEIYENYVLANIFGGAMTIATLTLEMFEKKCHIHEETVESILPCTPTLYQEKQKEITEQAKKAKKIYIPRTTNFCEV